jgi:hypothetical protein
MADSTTERFVARIPSLLAEMEERATNLFGMALTPTAANLPNLERIADFLWQMRASFDEQDRQINVLLLGTYLGEIARREQSGRWRVDAAAGLPVIDLPDGEVLSPMAAAMKWLTEGIAPSP